MNESNQQESGQSFVILPKSELEAITTSLNEVKELIRGKAKAEAEAQAAAQAAETPPEEGAAAAVPPESGDGAAGEGGEG